MRKEKKAAHVTRHRVGKMMRELFEILHTDRIDEAARRLLPLRPIYF